MKTSIIILAAFLLYGCTPSTSETETTEEIDTSESVMPKKSKEKIKTVTATTFRTNRFAPDKFDFEKRVIQSFDSLGNVFETKEFLLDSTILHKHFYNEYHGDTLYKIKKERSNVYNPHTTTNTSKLLNDKVIEETITNISGVIQNGKEIVNIPTPAKIVYEYDSQNRLKSTVQEKGGSLYSCNHTYNSRNQLVSKSCEGDKSSVYPYEERYEYNSKGLKIKQTETSYSDHKAVVEYKRYYQYNADDSLIFESWYRNGNNFLVTNFEFNEKGQRTAEFTYDGTGGGRLILALKHYYYYDWNGNLKMHLILGNNGDPVRTTLFAYDADNNLIQERRYTHSIESDKRAVRSRITTQYRYDFY